MGRTRRNGKIIDRWKIKNSVGTIVELPVRMIPEDGGYSFQTEYEGGPIFSLSDRDINALRQKVKSVCDSIVKPWIKKLHVNVEFSSSTYRDYGASLFISYSAVDVNTDAYGNPIYRDRDSTHVKKGTPTEGLDAGDMYALIDDSPLNRARLDGIIKALLALGERVSELMSPEKILATISNADRLLPAPGGKKK